jgi:hypothetical protein
MCADKFKELSNASWVHYFLLMDDQIETVRTEFDRIFASLNDWAERIGEGE